ncbi:hypothetical protein COLO4_10623 [Corchorus olitorius]|uniref:Uncharacterized protein n=1 Tax=Corchorus olitorius TaxID=93759 RepID=A0A1R3K7U6_9ROSI|nr:hypothetical protein COLO4_10623 [Corchorus olitorius]
MARASRHVTSPSARFWHLRLQYHVLMSAVWLNLIAIVSDPIIPPCLRLSAAMKQHRSSASSAPLLPSSSLVN